MRNAAKAYMIFCEFDINEDRSVYLTKEAAFKGLGENENLQEYLSDVDETVQDLMDEGLLGFREVFIYG